MKMLIDILQLNDTKAKRVEYMGYGRNKKSNFNKRPLQSFSSSSSSFLETKGKQASAKTLRTKKEDAPTSKGLYNQLQHNFNSSRYLENIKDVFSQPNGNLMLQNELANSLFNMQLAILQCGTRTRLPRATIKSYKSFDYTR